jgi:xanthine dehydrogenase molybdopterin-binding subunit B
MKYIGKETSRVEGAAKVTGKAKYVAEFAVPNLAHGYLVLGDVAKGEITKIDTSEAEKQAGVIKIITHENAPELAFNDKQDKDQLAPEGTPFRPFYTNKVLFNNQPIALVIAETFEQARFAACLVKQCRKARSQRNHLACCYSAWVAVKVKAQEMKQTVYQLRNGLFTEYLKSQLRNSAIPAL